MSQRKFITDENLKRFASKVKGAIDNAQQEASDDLGNLQTSTKEEFTEIRGLVTAAQNTADAAKSAAATAQSTANSKLSSVKSINGVSLVGTGNIELDALGIDGNIFIVCTELPKVNNAKYGKVYMVKNPTNVDPTGADTYIEYVKVLDESQSPAVDKWEKLGEWKPSVTVDSALSGTSTNPVQNKVVKAALDGKVEKVSGKGLSANDFTDELQRKLAGIADGANKTVVDTELSSLSKNPVQNNVIYNELAKKVTAVDGKQLSTKDYTAAEQSKLAGIASGATKVIVDTALTQNSGNAAQSGAVYAAVAACFKEADIVTLTNDDIDTLWANA